MKIWIEELEEKLSHIHATEYYCNSKKNGGYLYLLLWSDLQDILSEKQNQEGECKMLS